MEENEFEKQVQQKMSGLKIPPSDAVWDHVKINIEKRKSHRRLLLIFSFAFIALLSGWYYFSTKSSSSYNSLSKTNTDGKIADSSSINKTNNGHEKNKVLEKDITKSEPPLQKISSDSQTSKSKQDADKPKLKIHEKRKEDQPGNQDLNIAIIPPQHDGSVQNKIIKKDSLSTVASPSSIDIEKNKADAINGAVEENKTNTIDNIANKNNITDTPVAIIAQQTKANIDTAGTKKSMIKSTNKNKSWNVGFVLSGGVSHVGNQFLGLGYVSADYLQNAPSGSGQGVTISNPSKVKNAFGFIAGVFFEKAISTKTKFSVGINYKEFNTSNLVGQKSGSTSTYSSVNAGKQYNNNFKFIELPLKLSLQLGSNKKLPLFWSGGLTLSQLVQSNALQFDPYASSTDPLAKAYFVDNSLFNKTLLGLNTSFLASLFSNKKNTILAGPYFYYAASKLANEGLYSKKHFVYFGLQTEIIFNKK